MCVPKVAVVDVDKKAAERTVENVKALGVPPFLNTTRIHSLTHTHSHLDS